MAEAEPKDENGEESKYSTIQWNDKEYKLDDFHEDDNLPQVVQFLGNTPKAIPPGLRVFSEQPVLFYSRCRKKQVRARTIYRDPNGAYFEVGQTLLIPDDFEGWFEMVPPDFTKGRYCSNIAEVAKVMPKSFFTRSNIQAIRIKDAQEGEEQTFLEYKIPAGSVLRVNSTFSAKWRTSAESGLLKKKKQEWTTLEIRYLKCLDKNDKEVMIPFTCKGKFNIIYEKGVNDDRCIFTVKDLISNFSFPLKVRLLYGKAPVVPCIFTSMLVFKEDKLEESIIGSTIMNRRNVLFEIPFSVDCSVNIAESEDGYSEQRSYKDGRRLCHKYAISYATMIKLSPDLDTDQSMYQHIPTGKMKQADDSLRTLDLITNISLTDDEPTDRFMESSDSDRDSIKSSDHCVIPKGNLIELTELKHDRLQKRKSSSNV